jgi:hypothetical protein
MLDGVALIVSVTTIATVIVEGVKRAKTFYRAFEEFSALLASRSLRTRCHLCFFHTVQLFYADTLTISGTSRAIYQLGEGDRRPARDFPLLCDHNKSFQGKNYPQAIGPTYSSEDT